MDFGVLGFDPSSDIHTNLKWNHTTPDDDHFRDLKLPKNTTTSTSTSNSNNMLCFSSPTFPYHSRNSGTGYGVGVSSGMMMMSAASGFTPSQWMELEHQALIYKYITANVPIPSYLLNPIRKAFDSAPFPPLRSTSLGWGAAFHMGFSSTDPEPGRCRRTDGKKWRCSRDAVVDQKYCERHMNRGRHRSRKPVEPSTAGAAAATTTTTPVAASTSTGGSAASTVSRNKEIADEAYRNTTTILSMMSPKTNIKNNSNGYEDPARPEFGLVCSDSLLNPLIKSSSLVNYRTYNDSSDNDKPTTQLSISIPTTSDNHLEMGLGVGIGGSQHNRQVTNWVPISWEPSIGGPLGEALHTTAAECKPLNLMDGWDNHNHSHGSRSHGSRIAPSSSPTGVLQRGAFGSLSNSSAGSSPRAETSKNNNPYLPAI